MPTEPTAEELLELLAGGAALLGVTRYRARHAAR
jgi:hypothetical protein